MHPLSDAPRVLLLELIPDDPLRHYRAETFPFIAGLLEAAGVACEWVALGVPLDMSFDYRLSPADEAVVVNRVRRFRPSHLLINEHLVDEQWVRLRGACPETRFIFRDRSTLADLREFLADAVGEVGVPPALRGEDWLDQVTPRYQRLPANPLARRLRPFVQILAGPRCVYQRPLAGNPAYQGVDTTGCHDGCAFCGRDWTPYKVRSFVDFAVGQVLQAGKDLGDRDGPLPLDVLSAAIWARLEEFVGRLHDAGVRPFQLYLSPRLDELLAAEKVLDRLLPRLAARGDAIRLYTSGVESFSDAENLRFNKGIGQAEVRAATDRILGWRQAWPEVLGFAEQGLSAILFTPWTTLTDVQENLRHLDGNPLISADYALGTRLLLFPGRGVTRLAARDGLLAEAFDDHAGEAGCKIEWNQEELPWRFRHREVALLHRLARRLSGQGTVPPSDPEGVRVEAWRLGLPEGSNDTLTIVRHACAALAAEPGIGDLRSLAAATHRRLGVTAPFRWPGTDGRIVLDAGWRDRVADALHRVFENRPGLLSGATPGEIALGRTGGAPALRLEFRGPGGALLVLWMQDANLPVRSFLKNSAVALWIDGSTPLQWPWMEDIVRLVARVAERLASPGKGTPTSGRGARRRRPGSRSGG
ncbi:MAG: hypothetical protein ABIK09_04390 [Pseudomonadota bacterium]